MTRRRSLFAAFGACVLSETVVGMSNVFAQPAPGGSGKVWRVGFLAFPTRPPSLDAHIFGGFPRGMRELGYVEGKNLQIEWRFADGKRERLGELAAELVASKVDLIVASSSATLAAQAATATIPIVFAAVSDPIGNGLIKSLARPGANITGRTNITGDLGPKRMELLLAALPNASRVAVLLDSTITTDGQAADSLQAAGQKLRVSVTRLGARTPQEIETAFATVAREKIEGMVVSLNPLFFQQRNQIAELALKHRVPVIGGDRDLVQAGYLMSYGASLADEFRRLASYADRIFKGAKPADLPVEQPTLYELVINRKTAKAIGLAIPQELLLRSDEVIQ